jgi:phenylpyruvate tautomerase PptA (4-oxalocrotonate tautomerase family)
MGTPSLKDLLKGRQMPVLFIEAPPGIRPEAKKKLVEKITAAVDEAYHIGDTLIFLREYPAENVSMDGRLQSENPKILEALKKDQRRSLVLRY